MLLASYRPSLQYSSMSLSKQEAGATCSTTVVPPDATDERDEEERRSRESSESSIGSLVATAEIDAEQVSASASTSVGQLARRSGFGSRAGSSSSPPSLSTPGAYHVRPLRLGPADSVDGNLQQTALVRSTNANSTGTVSELSSPTNLTTTATTATADDGDPIVAYLVEDAACEAVAAEEGAEPSSQASGWRCACLFDCGDSGDGQFSASS